MFRCSFCSFRTVELKRHLQHRPLHCNLTNKFWCGFRGCSKSFREECSLRSHVRRTHCQRSTPVASLTASDTRITVNRDAKFVCSITLCKKEYNNRFELIKHLKTHIRADQTIQCPYDGCENTYKHLNSFTSHLTKKHRSSREDSVKRTLETQNLTAEENTACADRNQGVERVARFDDGDDFIAEHDEPDIENPCTTEIADPLLRKLAESYLKLESQLLIPSSTIQHIVSESCSTHELSQNVVKNNLRSRLIDEGLTPEKVNSILDDVFEQDPFIQGSDNLRTIYKRKKFYKKTFAYVEPIEVPINKNVNERTWFHYVPVEQTLEQLFADKSLSSEMNCASVIADVDVLSDITDGSVFQQSPFFNENPDGIRIILYQDGFEVVNPIGSAVQKHKMLGVYMSVGNLTDHTRAHVNSIKLVALCKEKEFDHKVVFGRIIEDLKKIESEGIKLPSGQTVKGTVLCITGDNLGSHQLGGFVENFCCSTYFCRYCLITRDKLQDENSITAQFQPRSPESYNAALEKIGDGDNYQGIKFNSVFNSLTHYHVCQPGLPPCLGHDLMEGIVAFDLKLYVDQLQKEGWFTYVELNKRIESFPYSTADRRDKPCPVSKTRKRIVGGAWQIWIFLKILPLLLHDKIKDALSIEWNCILLLTEIIEITCAPAIHKSCLPTLSIIISQYLALRLKFTPKLRPKHHYLTHYPELILRFGPLMKVWTMRFESKHAYFKRALRFSRNYINVTKAMSEKHELFQCLLRAGANKRSDIEVKGNVQFHVDMLNETLQAAIKKRHPLDDLQQCDEITIKGTVYKKGDALFISQKGYQHGVKIGRISMLLWDEENILVLLEVLQSIFRPHLRAYELGSCLEYDCLSLNDPLPSLESLHIYKIGKGLHVKPNYGLVRQCV